MGLRKNVVTILQIIKLFMDVCICQKSTFRNSLDNYFLARGVKIFFYHQKIKVTNLKFDFHKNLNARFFFSIKVWQNVESITCFPTSYGFVVLEIFFVKSRSSFFCFQRWKTWHFVPPINDFVDIERELKGVITVRTEERTRKKDRSVSLISTVLFCANRQFKCSDLVVQRWCLR